MKTFETMNLQLFADAGTLVNATATTSTPMTAQRPHFPV